MNCVCYNFGRHDLLLTPPPYDSALQDAQSSPLALLAATCSRIGAPAEELAGGASVRLIGAGQASLPNGAEMGWIHLPSGAIMDASGKPITGSMNATLSNNGNVVGQIMQQPVSVPQFVATAGPGGQIAYSFLPGPAAPVPAYQTVSIDGQEALVLPSSANGNPTQPIIAGGSAFLTPAGQILRAPNLSSGCGLIPNMCYAAGAAAPNFGSNLLNLGGNILNFGGMQQAVRPVGVPGVVQGVNTMTGLQVQHLPSMVQIPVSVNGQTAFQVIQLPSIQTFPGLQQGMLANGGMLSLAQGQSNQSHMTPLGIPTMSNGANDDIKVACESPEKAELKKCSNNVIGALAATHMVPQTQNMFLAQAVNPNVNFGLTLTQNQAGGPTLVPVNGSNMLGSPIGQMILTSQGIALTSFSQPCTTPTISTVSSTMATSSSQQASSFIIQNQQLVAGQNLQLQSQLVPNLLQVSVYQTIWLCCCYLLTTEKLVLLLSCLLM